MTDKQRKAIFPMLKECGCPSDKVQRIAWINGLLFAFGKNKVIASLNDLNKTQARWLVVLLRRRIEEND